MILRNNAYKTWDIHEIQMRPFKTAAYYISPIEIGLIWAKITHIKSHSKALGFVPQIDVK